MKRWLMPAALACAATFAFVISAQANTDLIISEYVEGSSNNKAIEIWNHTGAAVDLSAGGSKLQIYFNGALTAANTISLTGVLADNDAHVVAHSSAVPGSSRWPTWRPAVSASTATTPWCW